MPRREQPLESGNEVLLGLAGDLRQLRERAGSLTYRQLSARAHYSAAALSEAASGRKLPSLAVTLAYVRACDGDTAAWEARWREAAAELADPRPDDRENTQVPYVGLAAFQVSDADWFFGRDGLVADLLNEVSDHRFLGVFGASGSGKSSLLRAGLAARLIQGPGRAMVFTPGPHPLEECAIQLAAVTGQSPATLRTELAADPTNLHLRARQAMAARSADIDLVLVVDQFEEIFTLCHDHAERTWFISALTTAAHAPTSRTRVVLGVRADFYGHCGQHPQLVDALRGGQMLVGPMTGDELRLAITEPAVRAGCRVETALVARLIADAAAQPAVLPLISHALLETWRQRRGTTLTLTAYEAIGGIQHAIARTAEDLYTRLDNGQQTVAHQIFLRLIALGDGTDDTRRRIRRTELDDNPHTTVVLEKLAHARLIVMDRDSVELAHEAIIRHWPRLRDWLTDDRDGLRIHRDLTHATDTWESHHRDPDTLYRGTRLARAETWAAGTSITLSVREREFLHTSRSIRTRESTAAARRTRRLQRLVALLTVLVLLATATTVYAIRVQQTATEQRNRAIAQNVVSRAAVLRLSNPVMAAQLALAAYRLAPTRETRDSLISAVAAPLPRDAHSPAFRPDGRLLAIVSGDAATSLWHITYEPTNLGILGEHVRNLGSTAFTQDRRLLAVSRDHSTIQLWDISSLHPVELATFTSDDTALPCTFPTMPGISALKHAPDCSTLMFSPDGRALVSAGRYTTARLWDVTNPRQPRELATLDTPGGNVYAVAFSPDGHMLATVSTNGTARLWDISNRHHPSELTTLRDQSENRTSLEYSPSTTVVYGPDASPLAFSSHGRILALASNDTTIRLWDVTNPRQPTELSTLEGHTAPVYSMEFSPDGGTIATASIDTTVRLWDVTNPYKPTESATLTGHQDMIYNVTFSPDGSMLATSSIDGTNILWQTTTERAAALACNSSREATTITKAEWNQYFPGLDYQPPCP